MKREQAEAVKGRLECAICFSLMLPPIRQCAEGHNFCDRCCQKLMSTREATGRKCPSCRIALTNPVARARNLEQWAEEADVEVTCDYDECQQTFKYCDHAEHRKTCLGRTVCCPLKNCQWRGEPSALGAHLQASVASGGHKLSPTSLPTKYSNRHADYSTTVIFETSRTVGDARRWRPPRQLILVPANAKLGTEAVTFVAALWRPKGANQPFLASIQALRKPGHDETPFSFDLSLSAYPRPPTSLCESRASAVGPVADLSATEVWTRPKLKKIKAPVLVADHASMVIFNTASLDVNDNRSLQRYELHVRLVPLIPGEHSNNYEQGDGSSIMLGGADGHEEGHFAEADDSDSEFLDSDDEEDGEEGGRGDEDDDDSSSSDSDRSSDDSDGSDESGPSSTNITSDDDTSDSGSASDDDSDEDLGGSSSDDEYSDDSNSDDSDESDT